MMALKVLAGAVFLVSLLSPAAGQSTAPGKGEADPCTAQAAAELIQSVASIGATRQCPAKQTSAPIEQIPTTVSERPPKPAPYLTRACDSHGGTLDPDCVAAQARQCADKPGGFYVQVMVPVSDAPDTTYVRSGARFCQYPADPGRPAFPGFTEADLRRLAIIGAQLGTQPGRHTLKGAETNIYADAASQPFSVDIAGYKVDVRVKPSEYRWDYGDGTSLVTGFPGGPIPEARWGEKTVTSHVFAQTGDFSVDLTTVFTGEFSVDGGAFQPIAGNAQIPSAPKTLSVWRSEVKLYADDCNVNPAGAGCR